MGISVFQIIAIVFFVLAFVFLVLTIVTFFNQDIASVIGYFTGKTQRKQVEQIRLQTMNINYGAKSTDNSVKSAAPVNIPVNSDSSAHPSKKLARKSKTAVEAPKISSFVPAADGGTVSLESINADTSANTSTDVLARKKQQDSKDDIPTDVLSDDVPTDVLSDDVPTDVLSDDVPTDVLSDDVPTDVLSDDVPTDVLSDDVPTDVLSDDVPTDVLSDDVPTDVLTDDIQTTVLSNDDVETTVLSQSAVEVDIPEGFEFIESSSFKDTDEVIE